MSMATVIHGELQDNYKSLKETMCSALVRMPKDDEVYVKKTLDAGVNSIMFPAVKNKKEAKKYC